MNTGLTICAEPPSSTTTLPEGATRRAGQVGEAAEPNVYDANEVAKRVSTRSSANSRMYYGVLICGTRSATARGSIPCGGLTIMDTPMGTQNFRPSKDDETSDARKSIGECRQAHQGA